MVIHMTTQQDILATLASQPITYKETRDLEQLCVGFCPVPWDGTNGTLVTDLNLSSGVVKGVRPLQGITYNGLDLYEVISFPKGESVQVYGVGR